MPRLTGHALYRRDGELVCECGHRFQGSRSDTDSRRMHRHHKADETFRQGVAAVKGEDKPADGLPHEGGHL